MVGLPQHDIFGGFSCWVAARSLDSASLVDVFGVKLDSVLHEPKAVWSI